MADGAAEADGEGGGTGDVRDVAAGGRRHQEESCALPGDVGGDVENGGGGNGTNEAAAAHDSLPSPLSSQCVSPLAPPHGSLSSHG
eukprot:2971676-Pleurochrysis_carterae.AAC.1